MMDSVRVQKDVRVVGSYDVVVCGGGPAGFIAAIAAARQGAKTAIVEKPKSTEYFLIWNSI